MILKVGYCMLKKFEIAFCVMLDELDDKVYRAVNHRHAVAMTLKLVDDYEKYAHKTIEVYEWLKPFSGRLQVFVDDDLLLAIKQEHGTAKARMQAAMSKE